MSALLFCMLIPFLQDTTTADFLKGIVVGIQDGNTLLVTTEDKEEYNLVLKDIDCPELNQVYGDSAKIYLEQLILHKEIIFQVYGKDRNSHYIAIVLIDDNRDIRIDLLQSGLAWTAEKNPLPQLERYRISAEEKKIGLWKGETPLPPWIYRRQQSMVQPKSR